MPEIQELIAQVQNEVQQRTITNLVEAFDQPAVEAFGKLIELMRQSTSPSVTLKAIENILDRSQMASKRQIHSSHEVEGRIRHLHISGDRVRYMHSVLQEVLEPDKVPPFPQLNENDELVLQIDGKTGKILT